MPQLTFQLLQCCNVAYRDMANNLGLGAPACHAVRKLPIAGKPLLSLCACSTSKELVRDGRPGNTFPLLDEGLQVRLPAGKRDTARVWHRCIGWARREALPLMCCLAVGTKQRLPWAGRLIDHACCARFGWSAGPSGCLYTQLPLPAVCCSWRGNRGTSVQSGR